MLQVNLQDLQGPLISEYLAWQLKYEEDISAAYDQNSRWTASSFEESRILTIRCQLE